MSTLFVKRAVVLTPLFSGLLALAACGGGGGDSGPPAPKTWQPAQLLQAGGVVGNISAPALASDTAGNAMVVWTESDGRTRDVWARRYTRGAGWGAVQRVDNGDGLTNNPQVAFDSSGNALAVWAQTSGGVYSVWGNRHTPTGGWGTAQRIDTNDRGDALEPRIVADKAGRALVTWEKVTSADASIWASLYTAAQGWQAPTALGSSTGLSAGAPMGAFDARGNAHMVWTQTDGTRHRVWSTRYTTTTGWTSPLAIESTQVGDAMDAQIAVDVAGNALAVWNQLVEQRWTLWANRYTPGQGWGVAQRVEGGSTASTTSPQLAFDPEGVATLVWLQQDATRDNVRASRYHPSTGWTSSQLIETEDAGSAHAPRVVHDTAGNALAVWHQSDGSRTHIWTNRYAPATGWATAQRIGTHTVGDAGNPALALDNAGNAMSVWRLHESGRFNLWFTTYQ